MNAKKVLIQHDKKGQVPLGSLSHNELCRTIVTLMGEVTQSRNILKALHDQHLNNLASIDASEDKE